MTEPLTRAALIDAAAKAIIADYGVIEDEAADEAASAVDAVLPLIADELAAMRGTLWSIDCPAIQPSDAARVVRSLMGADDD